MLDIFAIYSSIKAGADDAVLDELILVYLVDQNIAQTVEEWRLENYQLLRKWAYPDPVDLNDAESKENSTDPRLIAKGRAAKALYHARCLEVKTRFPKPDKVFESVDELRAYLMDVVDASKQLKVYGGFPVNGVQFAFDEKARRAYLEFFIILYFFPTYSSRWKAATEWVTINSSLFQQLMLAAKIHVETCFNWQEAKEIELAACTTIEQLNAVTVELT